MTELQSPCQWCGKREGVTIVLPEASCAQNLCGVCVQEVMAFNTSHRHLSDLLEAAMRDWLDTWTLNPVFIAAPEELAAILLDSEMVPAAMKLLGEYRVPVLKKKERRG